jgi:hypothetical protein
LERSLERLADNLTVFLLTGVQLFFDEVVVLRVRLLRRDDELTILDLLDLVVIVLS